MKFAGIFLGVPKFVGIFGGLKSAPVAGKRQSTPQ